MQPRRSCYMTLPVVPDTFRWTEAPWGVALRCRALEPFAAHLFTTRQLPLSSAGDLARLARAVGASGAAMLAQVHGRDVVTIHPEDAAPPSGTRGDILVSRHPALAVAVRTADCVPLLIGDRRTGAVAAVHAGWRGTMARASEAAVLALGAEFGSRPADLVAAIGPSIGVCCYEVGDDVMDAFAAAGHERHDRDRWFSGGTVAGSRGRFRLDLARATRDQLAAWGVPEDQIHACGLCTAMHLDVLTSYRAEKARAGRLAAAICASVPV